MKAVEDPHGERRQADEKDVREHDPVQRGSELKFPGCVRKSGGEQSNDQRREKNSSHGYSGEENRNDCQHRTREFPGVLFFFLGQVSRKDWNERRAHGTFSHKPSKKIRNSVSS